MMVIKAIYNFLVGDMVILIGIGISIVLLALITSVALLTPLRGILGPLFVVMVLVVLAATLWRETRGRQ
jgi:hypothetical protein